MPVSPEVGVAIGGGLFMVGNVLVFWYREWKKHKTWAKNGKVLDEIQVSIDTVNGKVETIDNKVGEQTLKMTEIATTVKEQKSQCTKTVNRFDRAIRDQGKEMLELAKGQ